MNTPMPADHPETRVVESQALADRCLAFVEEQSCGEWGAEIECTDAVKLFHFVEDEIARHRLRSTDQQGMLREAATRLLRVFDQQRMTAAERIIVGVSDAGLREQGNAAINDLRAALTGSEAR